MTRINVIHPSELTSKHLVAEYRELPRVFGLAHRALGRGEDPGITEYTLGKGHVRFFYRHLIWLQKRHHALVEEMGCREFTVNFPHTPNLSLFPRSWLNDWVPTPKAIYLNRKRISERLSKT